MSYGDIYEGELGELNFKHEVICLLSEILEELRSLNKKETGIG